MHRRNDFRRSAHFDLRCSLAPKHTKEEFARQTAESRRRFAWSNRHPLVGSSPLDFEPASVKPPTQIAADSLRFAKARTHPMRKKPMGGPDRVRATSHIKSLPWANLALRRSANRAKGPGRTRQGPAMRSCSGNTR